MKIAPKPTPGQEVTLDSLLKERPERPAEESSIEEEEVEEEDQDSPVGQGLGQVPDFSKNPFSYEMFEGFARFHNLRIRDTKGSLILQDIDLALKPIYVKDFEDYQKLRNSCTRKPNPNPGWTQRLADRYHQWKEDRLPSGFMPASAITLYSIAKCILWDQLRYGQTAGAAAVFPQSGKLLREERGNGRVNDPAVFFPEKVWEPGILTYSFIIEGRPGEPDFIMHQDLLIFDPADIYTEIGKLPDGVNKYLYGLSPLFKQDSQVILGDTGSAASDVGAAFGFTPRICILARTRPKEGCPIRIERADRSQQNTEAGWVYGVRPAGGFK